MVEFWQKKRDIVLDSQMIEVLKLSKWQIRTLLLPGSEGTILTEWQITLFRQKFCPELRVPSGVDPFQLKPMPLTYNRAYEGGIKEGHKSLHKLFDEVKQSQLVNASDIVSTLLHTQPSVGASLTPEPSITPSKTPCKVDKPASQIPREEMSHGGDIGSGRRANRFAGKSHYSSKRAGSPSADPRVFKIPRLGGLLTRDDFVEELHDIKVQVKGDIERVLAQQEQATLGRAASRTQLMTELTRVEDSLSSQLRVLRTDLRALVQHDVHTALKVHRSQLKEDIDRLTQQSSDTLACVDAKLSDVSRIDTHVSTIKTMIQDTLQEQKDHFVELLDDTIKKQKDGILSEVKNQVGDMLQRLDVPGIVADALGQQKGAIHEMIQGLQTKAPPLPGQDGFLAQCIAPATWAQDQRAYESALLRAAWMYIHILGNPEDGVFEDENALEFVVTTCPGLVEDHIIAALDHVHMQGYGTLLTRKEQ